MIRIIVADDERFIREAVATVFGLEPDLEVVGVAADGAEAIGLALELRPDVAVLDLQMPKHDGIEVAAVLAERAPEIRVLMLTSQTLPGKLRSAIDAGVCGFVPKDTSADMVVSLVRKVAAGGRYIDPELAVDLIETGENPLTPRERQLLRLSLSGDTIEEIAGRVKIKGSTARNYLSRAITKMGANNRHVAAQLAQQRGWL
ncbi:MAG: response regulator transcription factor [Promicromonosporaceae bacterium]|nr:response regulator transcription factor [Promicromonosporaceae bacterium]